MGAALNFSAILAPHPVGDEDFKWFSEKISVIAGIRLSEKKRELVQSRLQARLESLKLANYSAYRRYLEGLPPSHEEWQEFVNCLTTNKTEFYRESGHFQHLVEKTVPQMQLKSGSKLRVWCAACSTGEEAYTIGAVLNWALPRGIDYSILASDLDTNVLARAAHGVYPRAAIEELPSELRHGNFAIGSGEIAAWSRVSKALRSKVEFKQINLLRQKLAFGQSGRGEKFDVIFCRNVFIYFPRETIREIVTDMEKVSRSGTVLYIGHSETLNGLKTKWKSLGQSVYILP